MHEVRCSRRNGFAVLELAAWSVALLPVALLGFSYGTFFHNDSAVRAIPATVLRETVGRVSQWHPDGDAGALVADIGRLREVIQDLARRAAFESLGVTYALDSASAVACYWVLRIDPFSGAVLSDQAHECAQIGPLPLQGSLEARGREIRLKTLGVPIGSVEFLERYADQVVLIGVEVGGLFRSVAEWRDAVTIQHGQVKRLRDEVEL